MRAIMAAQLNAARAPSNDATPNQQTQRSLGFMLRRRGDSLGSAAKPMEQLAKHRSEDAQLPMRVDKIEERLEHFEEQMKRMRDGISTIAQMQQDLSERMQVAEGRKIVEQQLPSTLPAKKPKPTKKRQRPRVADGRTAGNANVQDIADLSHVNAEARVLDRYCLDDGKPLGHGGWCVVRKAQDAVTGRMVALKTYHSQLSVNVKESDLHARFLKEVTTFESLGLSSRHGIAALAPHDIGACRSDLNPRQLFVNLLDFSRIDESPGRAGDGCYYTVLELADETLDCCLKRCASRPLDCLGLPEFCKIARSLACGLTFLHGRGFCHLDVKPANLMRFSGGEWKLIDLDGCTPLPTTNGKGDEAERHEEISVDCFTPLYACPELGRAVLNQEVASGMLKDISPSGKMDTWGAGVVLLDVLAHKSALEDTWSTFQSEAFADFNEPKDPLGFVELWYQWLCDPHELNVSELVREPSSSVALLHRHPSIHQLLQQLLLKNPSARLSADEFRTHPALILDQR